MILRPTEIKIWNESKPKGDGHGKVHRAKGFC